MGPKKKKGEGEGGTKETITNIKIYMIIQPASQFPTVI